MKRCFQDGSSMMFPSYFHIFSRFPTGPSAFQGCYMCHGQNMVDGVIMVISPSSEGSFICFV